MPALSISTIAATDGGAKAAAATAVPGTGSSAGSPFAILLAAISQADPDAQVQQTSALQPPPTSGTKQAAAPGDAHDPAAVAPIQTGAPNSAINATGPLSDTLPDSSLADETAANIKVDGKSGKKNAGDKDDDKAAADLPQAPSLTPSFLPAPIVPPQIVQVQIVANDNNSAAGAAPAQAPTGADGTAPIASTSPLPGASPGSTTTAPSQFNAAGAGTQPQATAASAPTPLAADSDGDDDDGGGDEPAGASEDAASVRSFPLAQRAAENFSFSTPASGELTTRPPLPPQAAQTAIDARNASVETFADAQITQTGGTTLAFGATGTASTAAPAPAAPEKAEPGPGVPRPAESGENIPAPSAPQNPTMVDVKSASPDFSAVQPAASEKTDNKPSRIDAAGTAPQPQPTPSSSAAQVAPSPGPQTTAVTLGGAAPQNGGPGGQVSLPIHLVAHDPDAAAGAAVAAPNTDALAVSIAARSLSGSKQFDIRLDPPELGRVEVRLSIDASGKTEAHMTADQPQTLALLQKDAPVLARALRDAGLDVSQNGLNFSLKGQGQNQGGQGGNFGAPSRGLSLPVLAQSIEAVQASLALPSLPGNARLDIHV